MSCPYRVSAGDRYGPQATTAARLRLCYVEVNATDLPHDRQRPGRLDQREHVHAAARAGQLDRGPVGSLV